MNDKSVKRYFRQKMAARRGTKSNVTELENLQVLCSWRNGSTTTAQAATFIGCEIEEVSELWKSAIEAGKRLVR